MTPRSREPGQGRTDAAQQDVAAASSPADRVREQPEPRLEHPLGQPRRFADRVTNTATNTGKAKRGTAALYHLINGLSVALPRLGVRRVGPLRSGRFVMGLAAAGGLLLLLGVAGFAGAFHDVRGRAIDSNYARLLEELEVADRAAVAQE